MYRLFLFAVVAGSCFAGVTSEEFVGEDALQLELANDRVRLSITVEDGVLSGDVLSALPAWSKHHLGQPLSLRSDANYALNLFWTDWRFPGHANNGDNEVSLGRSHFQLSRYELVNDGEARQWDLYFHGVDLPLQIKVSYRLSSDTSYYKRRVTVRDEKHGGHFLEAIAPRKGIVEVVPVIEGKKRDTFIKIEGSAQFARVEAARKRSDADVHILKAGDYGQPVALTLGKGGAFAGLEYPAAHNLLSRTRSGLLLGISQEIGSRIGKEWVDTAWAVCGLSANEHVKEAFFDYLDDISVAPASPYTLYNSWYDLRSVEYPKVPEAHHMNEANVLRMVDKVRQNMTVEHGIQLDGFVLDDGWDVYDSDWLLREPQFPDGMKPISDALAPNNTDLGIWFGPTGGYSFKMRRLAWMREHGYEVIHDYEMTYPHSMMCLAGDKYGALFQKRVVDFVKNDGVGFFKWDGIQFACSDPSHGHGLGKYSRRATMKRVIEICEAVRRERPDIYLNITSGTWLSPWWLMYANQIWMDGQDYAFADVASISKRDGAMTYRDFVLYDDLVNKDLWFPIANLMTHGIIKGKLDHIGGNQEALDKFTDNAVLYFARGVSMWELYISPDILTKGEWAAMSQSIKWARDRFPVLARTHMVGGDPMQREAYGYAHFNERKGVIAVRNPVIAPTGLRVKLDPSMGLDPDAANLVLERTYPTRWISPMLYAAGATVDLPLEGYETAVYEVYPLADADRPLLAGVRFEEHVEDQTVTLTTFGANNSARLLNPEIVLPEDARLDLEPAAVDAPIVPKAHLIRDERRVTLKVTHKLPDSVERARLAVLFRPEGSGPAAAPEASADGEVETQQQKGRWCWYTTPVDEGQTTLHLDFEERTEQGSLDLWLITWKREAGRNISFRCLRAPAARPMPPSPWPDGLPRKQFHLKTFHLDER